jgi:putative ABC transport system permease protein
MDEFFNISMTYIMIGLLAILAIAAASVGYVLVRNRVMFLVGVRNIPRRRAQTTLIIIGLMLSTVIISAAFSVGDTASYSVTNTVYNSLQSVDEIVQVTADDQGGIDDPFEGQVLVTALPMRQADAFRYVEEFKKVPNVDGAVSIVRGVGAVQNLTKQQAEPRVIIVGVEPTQVEGFADDLETTDGEAADLGSLSPDEIYVNESAAEDLDITPGDELEVSTSGSSYTFTVRDVLKDRVLTGSIGLAQGMVLPMGRAQEVFRRPDDVDLIAVSNTGGVRDSLQYSEAVAEAIEGSIEGTRLHVSEIKADTVDDAKLLASVFTTIFIMLGLFSIAAGVMLIFLIFVMLAAERKVEMGMMRAVGTKRSHLVQSFMSEGMVYNVGAAAVGCALGVGVGMIVVYAMKRLFAAEDLEVTFYVSVRSLIVSYSIGVVLTFLTVTFSSWRTGNLNIVSAIRDLPDQLQTQPRPSFRSPLELIRWFFIKSDGLRAFGVGLLKAGGAAAGIAAGVALFIAAFIAYDALGPAGGVIAVMMAIFGGLLIAVGAVLALIILNGMFQSGPLLIAAGIPLTYYGVSIEQSFPLGAGITLLIAGVAVSIQAFRVPARPVYTAMGVLILVFWLLFAGNNLPGTSDISGGPEMFFLSGVAMVLAGTFVLIYNADLMLHGLTLTGGLFTRLVPSIRTAVAYPLASKFRTGMTIAMIALVMFALVMMSTMNENFDRVFLSETADGGYDIYASEIPGNPIESIPVAMRAAGADASQITESDKVKVANGLISTACEVEPGGPPCLPAGEDQPEGASEREYYQSYAIRGVSDDFLQHTELTMQSRASGYATDRDVFEAMLDNPDYAFVDSFSISGGGGFGEDSLIDSIEPTDEVFDPISIDVRDSGTGQIKRVQVIGVLAVESSGLYSGLFLSDTAFDEAFTRAESSVHLLRVQPGADADRVAKEIEATLLQRGIEADSIKKIIDDFQAQSRGFLYLIQGFMGIGLFVSIAAVGVIAFRTVVERRQQIGMLRAIGYKRRAIALSFLMESSFTSLLGIFSGVTLGLLLAKQLTSTDEFIPGGIENFYIPWDQILFIGGLAFLASLLMTIIPSRQASSIPIAEALRYE